MVMALPVFLPLATVGAALAFVVTADSRGSAGRARTRCCWSRCCRTWSRRSRRRSPHQTHCTSSRTALIIVALRPRWSGGRSSGCRRSARRAGLQPAPPAIGLPRPVEATLTGEGVGAIRHASFESGLVFVETVTEWQDGRHSASRSCGISSRCRRRRWSDRRPVLRHADRRYEIQPIGTDRVRSSTCRARIV